MTQRTSSFGFLSSAPDRELYFFALYRLLEAALVAALLFSPLRELIGEPVDPRLASLVSILYLVVATALLLLGRLDGWRTGVVVLGVVADIAVAAAIGHLLPPVATGAALMLTFNLAGAALLLPLAAGLSLALLASLSLLGVAAWALLHNPQGAHTLVMPLAFTATYLAVTWLANATGQRLRSSQALAEHRGSALTRQVELNELIIRRMRTGVLLVDEDGRIRLANEAALAALGATRLDGLLLREAAHPLSVRLAEWRHGGERNDNSVLQLDPQQPAMLPRFVRPDPDSAHALVFLDDASLVSRRAESLTLSTLGRFAASLAHEVRNPLASISYAAQLLEESPLAPADRRMVQIIVQQCRRTNAIIETVMGLARRERAAPERLDLRRFVEHFVHEYKAGVPLETDRVEALTPDKPVLAVVDPRHLHQVTSTLVQNALNHGRLPGQPARVSLVVYQDEHPTLDVIDRGPGIPEAIAAQLFKPFYTTSEHGTGLGLYLAREICLANQATLEYVAMPGGGSCFRIRLPDAHSLLASPAETPKKTTPRRPDPRLRA